MKTCKRCKKGLCPGEYLYCSDCLHEMSNIKKPIVVTLCGSTRFYNAFQEANYRETMAGKIVLTIGFFVHSIEQIHGEKIGCTKEQKIMLDELHKRKIDLSDEILVLNVGGYIGESTRNEIEYALSEGIPVRYLEPVGMETWEQMGK